MTDREPRCRDCAFGLILGAARKTSYCGYLCYTGKTRGCPAQGCIRYRPRTEKTERLRARNQPYPLSELAYPGPSIRTGAAAQEAEQGRKERKSRAKMTPEEARARKNALQRKYYRRHRAEILEKYRESYREHREERRAYFRAYHARRKQEEKSDEV